MSVDLPQTHPYPSSFFHENELRKWFHKERGRLFDMEVVIRGYSVKQISKAIPSSTISLIFDKWSDPALVYLAPLLSPFDLRDSGDQSSRNKVYRCILSSVATTDCIFLIVLTEEVKLEIIKNLAGHTCEIIIVFQ